MEQSRRPRRYAIKDFVLDRERGTLTRGGADVPLRPKSFAVLQYLVEHAGQLEPAFDTLKRLADRVTPGCEHPPTKACMKLGQLWVSPLLGELRKWPPAREWSDREYPEYAARVESRETLYEEWR